MDGLHLFQRGDGHEGDFVIAADLEDALTLFRAAVDDDPMFADDPWKQIPANEAVTVCDVDEPGQPTETKTAAEWVAELGRRHWMSWA